MERALKEEKILIEEKNEEFVCFKLDVKSLEEKIKPKKFSDGYDPIPNVEFQEKLVPDIEQHYEETIEDSEEISSALRTAKPKQLTLKRKVDWYQ